jgi:hypothetical protein
MHKKGETGPQTISLLNTLRSANPPARGHRLQRRIDAPRRSASRNGLCGTPAAAVCLLALALGAATAAGAAAGDAGPTAAADAAPQCRQLSS